MSKIYVELRSGLGNQLFQFAFGYSLAREFNKELVLCPSYFDPQWKFWLKKILGREARSFRLPLILSARAKFPIENRFNYKGSGNSIIVVEEQNFDLGGIASACSEEKDVYLKGYWQNPALFLKCSDQIQRILNPSFALSEKFQETVKDINHQIVGIHVRRGDFLTNTAFGACTLAYYLNAIQTISKQIDNPTFLVFTNNKKWVEKNFPKDIAYTIYSNELNAYTD